MQDPRMFLAGLNSNEQQTLMNFQAQFNVHQGLIPDANGLSQSLAMGSALNSDLK